MPRPILIYGATGFTGRCCIDAMEALRQPYLVGGRSAERLQTVAGPHCTGVRVAEAADPGAAFEGVGCVVSTVGPFARFGLPVLDAAIAAGAHYVDTTAEQSFLHMARTRDDAARAAGVTALPACGVEYAPMMLAAALLGPGPVRSWLWLDDFLPTAGSVRSMVAMAGVGPTPWPRSVRVEERRGWALRIPGAEEVLVHPDSRSHLVLRRHEAWPFTLSWRLARRLPLERIGDAIARRITDPTAEQRAQAGFTVVVARDDRALRIDGTDVYASTGHFAVQLARLLAEGQAVEAGVCATGAGLSPAATLDVLGLQTRSVTLDAS